MPQMSKGGKFVFGLSAIREDGTVQLPSQAADEYRIASEGKVYLFTGSKSTGGFCVTRRGLLEPSKLGHILEEVPDLREYASAPGRFLKYKGRSYCWIDISEDGKIVLTKDMLTFLGIATGDALLCIRSSDISFTMGAKGPLVEKARAYQGDIPTF